MRWRLLLVPVAILTSDAFEASAASTPLTTAATSVTGDRWINGELLAPSALLIAKGNALAPPNAGWRPIRISYARLSSASGRERQLIASFLTSHIPLGF